MSEPDDLLFTVDQIATVSTAMRVALGLPPKHVDVAHFVAMISDEIEHLRAAGWDDAGIADFVRETTGEPLRQEALAEFYVKPEHRGRR
ncbi:hypothetical protein [Lichenihabitans psoromatis]|uniref:hypothetical protein n=1 Tax=Lichenihabitans psoromatis TaxID=2528642 RepID=UPI0010368842|nr:hypothetical protein [Lichenihabitans psoromatis]